MTVLKTAAALLVLAVPVAAPSTWNCAQTSLRSAGEGRIATFADYASAALDNSTSVETARANGVIGDGS